MLKILLLVGGGGFLGTVARYLLYMWVDKQLPVAFPWGTFGVNMIGCFLIGMIVAGASKGFIDEQTRLFLVTGFCGGFTTFSTFSFDGIHMLQQGHFATFSLYVLGSVALGLLAAYFGFVLLK